MQRRVSIVLALSLLTGGIAQAQAFSPGPPVGSQVPALQVTDSKGSAASIAELAGQNGLVLVFVRSAKWCPFCQKQMVELREAVAPLAARGYRIAALSYDPAGLLNQFATKWDIAYPLLSDPGSVTIDAWKLRDMRHAPGSFAWGTPYSSIFVISPTGTLKAKFAEEDYKTRPPLSVILTTIDGLANLR